MAAEEFITVTTKTCFACGKTGEVVVPRAGFDAWRGGALIQRALPELPAHEREQLVTGTHPACWAQLIGEEE